MINEKVPSDLWVSVKLRRPADAHLGSTFS